jgi:lysophospholipase L1-like esterase
LGDSITAGQYLPSEQAWPQQLAEITGHEVHNCGVANETTRQGLERFPRHVQERSPYALIIQFGLNDCNRWATDRYIPRVLPQSYRANLAEMISRARAFDVATIVICGLTPVLKSKAHALDAEHYDELAREVADLFGVEFYPSPVTREHLLDDVHLTAEGHRIFAEGAARCLGISVS